MAVNHVNKTATSSAEELRTSGLKATLPRLKVMEVLPHAMTKARGFALREHVLALYGLCSDPACQAAK